MIKSASLLNILHKRCSYLSLLRVMQQGRYSQKCVAGAPTLYVPGSYGNKVYQIIKPLIDADDIINNLDEVQSICRMRNIPFESTGLVDAITKWRDLRAKASEMTKQYNEFMIKLQELDRKGEEWKNMQEKKAVDLKALQEIRNELYDIEDRLMPVFHSIPNKLHPETPLETISNCNYEVNKLECDIKSHSTIGEELGILEFSSVSPSAYYLTGTLALLELAIQNFYHSHLQSLNFQLYSCVDFCKSFVFEGCGKDPYSNDHCIPLTAEHEGGQRLNIVGSSSLESFCAYFINMNVESSTLPYRCFSLGRFYNPTHRNEERSLFSVLQSNCVHGLILSEVVDADAYFNELSSVITSTLSLFSIPFRKLDVSMKDLNQVESRKICFELWSPYLDRYIPCSDVIQCNDFVSKRLQMTCGTGFEKNGYLNVVHGKLITIPTLIGCIMENMQNSDGTFNIPDVLQKYMVM